ncbi:lipoprotein [Listeria weihenstephanensis FSL R9-0317]|uniref:Lipoprotein n=1 Tax=Listeria weihenstephanensis TaxID=1006155 RepID=A0A1S7FTB6_9LIST|nr:hypothetical protein [Listeria weihenstephanensis]AQY50681.1 hypothetical protein UE46_06305 [Listeria weihenstephanensis]EUJ36234.1 lipoprotein [Listeria weihenstephanensis FSL R9-0317]
MKNKKNWLLIGSAAGALGAAVAYAVLNQKTLDPFEEGKVEELDLEENNMVSEGAMSTIDYENKRQELKK